MLLRKNLANSAQHIPLRLVLIVPFLLQIVTAVGLTGWFSLRNGQKAINDLATQLEQEVSDRIDLHLDTYLATPHDINQINADAVELGLLDLQDFEGAGHYTWRQMQVFDVGYIYYVLETGEYAGAGIFEDPNSVTIDELSAATDWRANTYATDERGNRTELTASYDDYNPQEEAAYTDAVAAGEPIWSQIYQWDNFPDIISISASYPLYDANNSFTGVLVTNLRLSQIGDFLRQNRVSDSGRTFVLERDGLLVASSSDKPSYAVENGSAKRLNAVDSTDPLIQATSAYLIDRFGDLSQISQAQSLEFELDNERQFVQVTPWQDEYGLDWLVVVAVPESDFMAQINANTRTTVLLCLAALAIATLLGIHTSGWIARPILRLNQASKAVASGELDQDVKPSNIRELNWLAQSFNQMTDQLRNSFAALAKTNEELEQRVEDRTAELQNTLQELQKTQTQMIQAEKMSSLGQLVAGVAHEVNNPVNFIHGNLIHIEEYIQSFIEVFERYQAEYPNPSADLQSRLEALDLDFVCADLPKVLTSMKGGSERIREIVKSLRTFSRLDEAEVKAVDIHEGIESTLLILQHRLKARVDRPEIEVIRDYGKLPLVECYPGQLNQVFMNILANAVDVLDEQATQCSYQDLLANPQQITIRSAMISNQWIEIAIADNGSGMTETARHNVFNPFFTTKPVGKGTGLGMSISYQIITERHNGKLTCLSTVGHGTEFVIRIPA